MARIKIETIAHDSDAYWEALLLRDRLLRAPLGLDYSEEDIAAEAQQVHVVAVEKGEVVGVLLLRGEEGGVVRMRQVAVAKKRQGRGIGRDLVKFAEALVWAERGDEIHLHAREEVVEFYEGLDYERVGEVFVEVGIPHLRMRKRLDKE
jgi:predicted GNAT family N-acyltransferase